MAGSRKNGITADAASSAEADSSAALPIQTASNAWRVFPCTPAARAASGVTSKWIPGTASDAEYNYGADWAEPSIEEVEAEFWRIVESPDEQVEALYGQDIDSATYCSAFPTIKVGELGVNSKSRLNAVCALTVCCNLTNMHGMLGELCGCQVAASCTGTLLQELATAEAKNLMRPSCSGSKQALQEEDPEVCLDPADTFASCCCGKCQLCTLREYTRHPWNINNLPQAKGSVLRFVREDVGGKPITGKCTVDARVMTNMSFVLDCLACWLCPNACILLMRSHQEVGSTQ